jgi:putative MATE family efflux protein
MPHAFSKDLTEGSVARNLVSFALPLLASTVLQAFYNVADMLIVGIFTDSAGLSGVTIGGMVTVLVTNVVIGLASGGMVLISQCHGAKRYDDEKKAIGSLMGGCLVVGVALTAIMTPLAGPIASLLRTPPESYHQARDYLAICMTGSVFILGYNALSSVMRGLGDSKRPFLFIAVATVANVILDVVMVGPLRMGAAGAAWATVASQALSLVLSIAYLMRRGFHFSLRIDRGALKRLLAIGLPMGIQQFVVQVSFVFLGWLINGFGVAASAASGICSKVNSFAILPGLAMLSAVSAMAGQNVGAGRYDRALHTSFAALKVIMPVAVVIFAVVNLFTGGIIRIFSRDPAVIADGLVYMRYLTFDALFATALFCLAGLFNGAGRTTFTLFNSILSSIVIRVPLAWLFAETLGMGLAGVGLASAVAPLGALAAAILYLASGRWKKSAVRA